MGECIGVPNAEDWYNFRSLDSYDPKLKAWSFPRVAPWPVDGYRPLTPEGDEICAAAPTVLTPRRRWRRRGE